MHRIIGVTELQRKFRTVFDEVVERHTPYILTRGSRPEAVIIPYEHYLKFVQADEVGILDRVDRAFSRMTNLNAQYTDKEIETDLMQATKPCEIKSAKPNAGSGRHQYFDPCPNQAVGDVGLVLLSRLRHLKFAHKSSPLRLTEPERAK